MVRPSFAPPPDIRELREVTAVPDRRPGQGDSAAREDPLDAGVKLTSVASTVWSVSSRAMIDGERDSVVLADMAKGKIRAKTDQLAKARDQPDHDPARIVA